ncbi:YiaA/YiaB family inner membrane protein [Labrenzia sp. CE80]|uniref:YiaA/YiaB family inner membrane protein n=1 Tax=Labrenzia sp. CE80 TaxID=1788986 RepID=UPI00129B8D64|nr:YiaA/YiaB family inner membrane protein [Labrenzia sp. CE80]
MPNYKPKMSNAWNLFTYFNFGVAVLMMGIGIWSLEASFSAKGFYAMAALMLVYSTASITKAVRDTEESDKIYNKIEDARTERLLSEVSAKDSI